MGILLQHKKVLVGNGLLKPVLRKLQETVTVLHIANKKQFLHEIKDADGVIGFHNYMKPELLDDAKN